MFCGNCGANNPDDARMCGSCGAPLTTGADSDSRKLVKIGIIVGGIVLVLAVIALIVALVTGGGGSSSKRDRDDDDGGSSFAAHGSAEDVAVAYMQASFGTNSGRTLVELLPETYMTAMLEESDEFDSKSDLIDDLNEMLKSNKENIEEYFGRYTVKVESRGVEEWKNSEVKDYNERMEDRDIDLEIEAGADVELKITMDGEEDEETTKPTVSVIKVDGKWYVEPYNNSNSLF